MYRRISIIAGLVLVVLAGCNPPGLSQKNETKKIVQKADHGKKEKKVQVTPKIKSTDQYRTVANFKPGATRGHILYGVDNRLDIDELQTGLMRLSKSTFSPDKYIYEDGQFLDQSTIESWLENKDMNKHQVQKSNGKMVTVPINPDGLNPELPKGYHDFSWQKKQAFLEKNPSYLSYIVEQGYLVQSDNKLKLGGVSLAISMANVYTTRIKDSDGKLHDVRVPLDTSVAKKKAKKYAQTVLKRLLSLNPSLKKVPIVIGLYQEESADSIVPGSYFAKTVVHPGDNSIGDWKPINESHVLFPSPNAKENHKADADRFAQFTNKIQKYFPNFIGVIGKGFYKNGELQHFTVEIPIKFYGETEVISFTQYVTGLVSSGLLDKQVPLDVYISSSEGPEAIIVRKPDMDQPFVHIYH
ncbi:MAG TPA: CamS family sex pheromone protein [Bacillales bacterium]|nr:CamS family sex pheromone protein [Bacillales bacterium]